MLNYSYTLKVIVSKAVKSLHMISESEFKSKSFPKKWSKKEILGHLIDSAVNNLRRFTKSPLNDQYIFERYHQDRWVEINDYQNRQSRSLIELWESINYHIAYLISRIPDEHLLKKTTNHNFHEICMLMVEEGSESSLSYLIWDYLYHMEHHLSQIISNYDYELTNFEDE
jgi:hypothetical protein